jgi:hypothetical protein
MNLEVIFVLNAQVSIDPRDRSQTNPHNLRAARAVNCANPKTIDRPSTPSVSPGSPRNNPRVPVLKHRGSSTILRVFRAARTPAIHHGILGFEQTNLLDHPRDWNARRAVISDQSFIDIDVNNQRSAHALEPILITWSLRHTPDATPPAWPCGCWNECSRFRQSH